MRHAREECIVFYVASPSRLFSATRAAGEMTRTASARAGGRKRERESKAERFFRFPLDGIGNLKSRIENGRFFFQEEEEGSVGSVFELYYGGKEIF